MVLDELASRKGKLEILRLHYSIEKLQVSLLELDEQKIKINESVIKQQEELKEIEEGGNK